MKKFLALIVLLGILVALVPSALAQDPRPTTCNIRVEPGLSSASVGEFKSADFVQDLTNAVGTTPVNADGATWYRLTAPVVGWVAAPCLGLPQLDPTFPDYVAPVTPTPPAGGIVAGAACLLVVTDGSGAQIYSSAPVDQQELFVTASDALVESYAFSAQCDFWIEVRDAGVTVYVIPAQYMPDGTAGLTLPIPASRAVLVRVPSEIVAAEGGISGGDATELDVVSNVLSADEYWTPDMIMELFQIRPWDGSTRTIKTSDCEGDQPGCLIIEGEFVISNPFNEWMDGDRPEEGERRLGFRDASVGIPPLSVNIPALRATLRIPDSSFAGDSLIASDTERCMAVVKTGVKEANLRTGPGDQYPAIGVLFETESLPIIGVNTPLVWHAVQMTDTVVAWIWSTNVDIVGDCSAISEMPAPPIPPWTEEQARVMFGLGADAALAPCDGESDCYMVTPASGSSFSITNNTAFWQDGYRTVDGTLRPGFTDAKVGIPPFESVEAVGATVRRP